MRKAFAALAGLVMLVVVVQFFLAASGAFDTAPNDESFQPHRTLGFRIVLLAVLLTVVAAVARTPGRLVGLTGLVAGLVVLQAVIRAIAAAFGDTGDHHDRRPARLRSARGQRPGHLRPAPHRRPAGPGAARPRCPRAGSAAIGVMTTVN